jgi:hypothetical protein
MCVSKPSAAAEGGEPSTASKILGGGTDFEASMKRLNKVSFQLSGHF